MCQILISEDISRPSGGANLVPDFSGENAYADTRGIKTFAETNFWVKMIMLTVEI